MEVGFSGSPQRESAPHKGGHRTVLLCILRLQKKMIILNLYFVEIIVLMSIKKFQPT